MKKQTITNKKLLLCFIILFHYAAWSQMPVCTGPGRNIIYSINYDAFRSYIYNYDPYQPYLRGTNPVLNTITPPPLSAGGLAVCPVLNSSSSYPTFYTLVNDGNGTGTLLYCYYNGTAWVNTGHKAIHNAANLAGGGTCIYNLSVGANSNGEIYKYTGTGDETLFLTIPNWIPREGGNDIMADCDDNLYVPYLGGNSGNSWLRKYSSKGVLLHTWKFVGMPKGASGGGGTAIVGNLLVIAGPSPTHKGILDLDSEVITLTPTDLPEMEVAWNDCASCPLMVMPHSENDTVYYCGSGPGTSFRISGAPPYSYSVLNGNAVITGSGPSYTVISSSGATIVTTSNKTCGAGTDTFHIIVPTATINAGIDGIVSGCGVFIDTLHATLSNTTAGLIYNIAWSPLGSIVANGNTLDPIVKSTNSTTYVLKVSTPQDKGGCVWIDSVHIMANDLSVFPDFSYSIIYGCNSDSVVFSNTSTAANKYKWHFGDNNTDTIFNPVHAYNIQGVYLVQLDARNKDCADTIVKDIDTKHPLLANFKKNKDTICQGNTVSFINTSVYNASLGTIHYLWDFGDGFTDTTINPNHAYNTAGIFRIRLIITDFIPCSDTAYQIIVVDSIPYLSFTDTPQIICKGGVVLFKASYLSGAQSLIWDYGDGTRVDKGIYPIANHRYDNITGTIIVTATASYKHCPDASFKDTIIVSGYPIVNLGPDTSICPGQEAITLMNLADEPAYCHHLWSTHDTVSQILVNKPAIYWLQITSVDGCTSTDSVQVLPSCFIAIPNVFTPNGDDINDYFFPRNILGAGVAMFHMKIFNRWGQMIFETQEPDGRGWDGRFNGIPQLEGVYIYLIDAAFINGSAKHYQGNVTLVR